MSNGNILLTLVPALLLWLVHIWASLVHPERIIAHKYWLSFADGVSITYIFLQLLSEVTELIHNPVRPTNTWHSRSIAESTEPYLGWLEHYPFLPLLAAVVIFYGLQRLMEQPDQSGAGREAQLPPLRIWIHLAGFSFYKMLIGYILAGMTDAVAVTVFTIAMALHFFVVDFHLVEIHPSVYARIGRWVLGVAFLVGWYIGNRPYAALRDEVEEFEQRAQDIFSKQNLQIKTLLNAEKQTAVKVLYPTQLRLAHEACSPASRWPLLSSADRLLLLPKRVPRPKPGRSRTCTPCDST